MKTSCPSLHALLLLGLLGAASLAPAQTPPIEDSQSVATVEGTLAEFGPQAVVIRTDAGAAPVRYISRDTTKYEDENGSPVRPEGIGPGRQVTVYYTKAGDMPTATRVIVRSMPAGSATTIVKSEPPVKSEPSTITRTQSIDITQPIATPPTSSVVETTQPMTVSPPVVKTTVNEQAPGLPPPPPPPAVVKEERAVVPEQPRAPVVTKSFEAAELGAPVVKKRVIPADPQPRVVKKREVPETSSRIVRKQPPAPELQRTEVKPVAPLPGQVIKVKRTTVVTTIEEQ